MSPVIKVAAVEDNKILVDSLRAWARGIPDIRLIAITPTVDDLLRAIREPPRPPLSEREHAVLMAYASGRTLDSVARYLGISVETAKTYLKRIKAKYQLAGLPVHTKLDLAEQVRADCAGGTCSRPSSG